LIKVTVLNFDYLVLMLINAKLGLIQVNNKSQDNNAYNTLW